MDQNKQQKTRLRLDSLSMQFPGVKAVDQATLAVEPGEFFTLLGPSGCGKTTMLRTIAGFYRQTEGSIYFNDDCIDKLPAHKRDTGMVFQNYAVFPHLTVWKNVAYGLKARKIPKSDMDTRIKEALKLVHLEGYEARRPSQLSGGQQQRVVLARAFVIHPRLLLMDEPLANLDAKLRVRLRLDLRELQQRLGITTIYVTHDQDEALSLSDRIAVMFDGKVQQMGKPGEVYRSPATQQVADFIGEGNFYHGRVMSMKKDAAVIQLDSKNKLAVTLHKDHEVQKDTEVVIGFRPHDAKLYDPQKDQDASNVFEGVVEQRMYFGSLLQYHLDLGEGRKMILEEYGPTKLGEYGNGDSIKVKVPEELILMFDKNTGKNINVNPSMYINQE